MANNPNKSQKIELAIQKANSILAKILKEQASAFKKAYNNLLNTKWHK